MADERKGGRRGGNGGPGEGTGKGREKEVKKCGGGWKRRKQNAEHGARNTEHETRKTKVTETRARTFKYTYVPTRLFILVAARRIAAEGQDRVNLPLVVYRSQYSVV